MAVILCKVCAHLLKNTEEINFHKNCTDLIKNLEQMISFTCVKGMGLYHVEEVQRQTINIRQDTRARYKFNAVIHHELGYQHYGHKLLPLPIHSDV